MEQEFIIAGLGGQGVLFLTRILSLIAQECNLPFIGSEIHGMSQRGGDVQSHFRLADYEISSDLIPLGKADLIISVEPMEALRYLPWLSADGWLITNSQPFVNIPNYPDEELIKKEIDNYPIA